MSEDQRIFSPQLSIEINISADAMLRQSQKEQRDGDEKTIFSDVGFFSMLE